jgi:hypothetical protein
MFLKFEHYELAINEVSHYKFFKKGLTGPPWIHKTRGTSLEVTTFSL